MKKKVNNVKVIQTESFLPLNSGGKIRVHYEIFIYQDIHKIRIDAAPYPEIREWSAVTKWYIRERNEHYRRRYGPALEYKQKNGSLIFTGENSLRDESEDIRELKSAMNRKLSEDYPRLLNLYFGIVPETVRKELLEMICQYEEELKRADISCDENA